MVTENDRYTSLAAVSTLTFGSAFSGIGGMDLGLERAGMTCRWQVEIEPFCQSVLARHWPDVARYGDIKELDVDSLEGVDLVAGGPPCQPVSYAGVGMASEDPRWLWPDFFRLVRGVRPRFVLVENPPALFTRGFDYVLGELAFLGFDAEWSVLSACAVGAPHARERLFLLAYRPGDDVAGALSHHPGQEPAGSDEPQGGRSRAWTDGWVSEPPLDRVAHGLPRRVVRPALEGVGNAVVPQVAEWVGRQLVQAVTPETVPPLAHSAQHRDQP